MVSACRNAVLKPRLTPYHGTDAIRNPTLTGKETAVTKIEKIEAATARKAELHRMVMPGHTCPWGLKSLHLLKSRG